MKWVLIPGLGLNHRLFANIIDLLEDHHILEFETPDASETIENYALRLSEQIQHDGPLVLGGVSFGGMLASVLCRQLQPRALVLMSSTSNPYVLRRGLRSLELMSRALPSTIARWVSGICNRIMPLLEPIPQDQLQAYKDMIAGADLDLIRHGARMIMQWRVTPIIDCPKFHLHGSRDLLMPVEKVKPTQIVDGAGHLMNLTHVSEVRRFIQDVQQKIEG